MCHRVRCGRCRRCGCCCCLRLDNAGCTRMMPVAPSDGNVVFAGIHTARKLNIARNRALALVVKCVMTLWCSRVQQTVFVCMLHCIQLWHSTCHDGRACCTTLYGLGRLMFLTRVDVVQCHGAMYLSVLHRNMLHLIICCSLPSPTACFNVVVT